MQPASKSKKWATQTAEDDTSEPPSKIQAIEVPEAESDNEYESVPKKKSKSRKSASPIPIPAKAVVETPTAEDEPMVDFSATNATDDDWIRSRTNRLLDLVDPEDMPPAQISKTANVEVAPAAEESPFDGEQTEEQEEVVEEEEKPDPNLEEVKKTGRLFVRNLPYVATEEELKKHFEPFGALEEVLSSRSFSCFFPAIMMNIQIGTAYATSI